MGKFVLPEIVPWVFDEFHERDQQAPGVRPVHDQPFQQHPGDLFLDDFVPDFRKQVQQHATEIMRVAVGVPQLVGNGIEEMVPSFPVQLGRQFLQQLHRDGVRGGLPQRGVWEGGVGVGVEGGGGGGGREGRKRKGEKEGEEERGRRKRTRSVWRVTVARTTHIGNIE